MRKLFLLPVLLFVIACQGAATIGPTVSKDELLREQQYQRSYVKDANIKQYDEAPKVTSKMKSRFNKNSSIVGSAGERLCEEIGFKNCKFGFKLEEKKELNAYADGENIIITTPMMMLASKDEELANVLAHEYAHNIMSHVAKTQQNVAIGGILGTVIDAGLNSQGIDTGGQLGQFGAQTGLLRYSVGFEREADYIGLYILKRAGYNPDGALNFWRKMSVANESSIDTAVTHPTNPERFVAMKKTIAEINYKAKNKRPLLPEFKPED